MGRHVVFVAPPAPGHVYPSLALVEELIGRGHRVSYVTSPALAPVVVAAGATVLELDWEPDTSSLSDTEFTIETLVADMNGFLAATQAALPALVARLRQDVPDLVCADAVALGPLLAGIFGAPMVTLVPNLATNAHFPPSALVPAFDPTHPALADYGARVGALFAAYGLPAAAMSMGGGPEPGLRLVFVPREFQIAGETFDESYHFIGPDVGQRARVTDWSPTGDGPLLLVSLGTAFNNRPEFFTAVADAFTGSEWQVVMALGAHTDPRVIGPVPPNVRIATAVPQLGVLRHAAAFISHGGMGSTMEALYYQVPLVAVPQVHEQVINAARVQELGLGRHLRDRTPTATQLREAVEQVSADEAIRANLAVMKHALLDAGGAGAGADAIEHYLRNRA